MSSNNFENLLLKSLIEDLDTANEYPKSEEFSTFEKKFNNSTSSQKDSFTDDSSKSDTSFTLPQSILYKKRNLRRFSHSENFDCPSRNNSRNEFHRNRKLHQRIERFLHSNNERQKWKLSLF